MTNNLMPSAIFWDMDGTLIDTEPLWEIATYELSERLGKRLTPELRDLTIGGSFHNTLSIAAEHAGVEPNVAEEHAWMIGRMQELFSGEITPLPGVRELLGELKEMGIPMLLTTNTERPLLDSAISAIGWEFFDGSIAGDEVVTPKPDPEMYVTAARVVDKDPAQCLIFEDSWNGMTAAGQSGCHTIGLAEKVPENVVSMLKLAPTIGFEGVSSATVSQWWTSLVAREEL